MEPPVSQHATVTAWASDTGLTSALPAARVTQSATSREDGAHRVAGAGFAGVRGSFWSAGVSKEALPTVLAVPALCVVAAVVTHPPTAPSCSQPQSPTEVTALGLAVTLALLALMRCPCDAVGSLPGLVIVERGAALAVLPGRVVSAHTLAMDHVVGLLFSGLVALGWYTVVSVSIAKTTAFDNKIIDGIVVCGEEGGSRVFGLAGTLLALQQTDAQVGDHELVLGGGSIWVHRVPGRQRSVDHLSSGARECS